MKFNYNVKSRFQPVFWGVVFILAAVLLILDGVGVELGHGVTPWRIIIGVLLLGWTVYELVQLKIASIFFPLAFLFLAFEAPIGNAIGKGEDIISNWVVLLAALLLTIGFSAILPKQKWTHAKRLGRTGMYLNAESDLRDARIDDNMGNVHVYITNRGAYDGNGVITVTDNIGTVTLHIPGTWLVSTRSSDNIGKVIIPPQDYECSKGITLVVRDNIGTVTVEFV